MAEKKKKPPVRRPPKKFQPRPALKLSVEKPDGIECYINSNWHDDGMATLLVLRKSAEGDFALAGFLIDVWCCGLKDAWGRLSVTRDEFETDVLSPLMERLEIQEADIELARRLVVGGIFVAQENGFKLPQRFEPWAAIIGARESVDADISDFGTGTKPRWRFIGAMADLVARLTGPIEVFLNREDVEIVTEAQDDLPELYANTADPVSAESLGAVEEAIGLSTERMLNAVRRWCFAQGIAPHARLPEAMGMMFESMMQLPDVTAEVGSDEMSAATFGNINRMLEFEDPKDTAQLREALEQVRLYADQFDNPDAFLTSLGLGKDMDDDEP